MATTHMPRRRPPGTAHIADTIRAAFWVTALGLIACYAFFVALGAFTPGDVVGVSIAVGVLLALWLAHAWSERHAGGTDRDPRMRVSRERRGF